MLSLRCLSVGSAFFFSVWLSVVLVAFVGAELAFLPLLFIVTAFRPQVEWWGLSTQPMTQWIWTIQSHPNHHRRCLCGEVCVHQFCLAGARFDVTTNNTLLPSTPNSIHSHSRIRKSLEIGDFSEDSACQNVLFWGALSGDRALAFYVISQIIPNSGLVWAHYV
jgi:hypothetical protein